MQRPWGRTRPGSLEEQQGDPCVWSRVSEGERGRRGGQGEDGAGCAGPCGPQGVLRLLPPGRWNPGGLWAEEGRGLTQVLTCTLWCCFGEDGYLGARIGVGVQLDHAGVGGWSLSRFGGEKQSECGCVRKLTACAEYRDVRGGIPWWSSG